MKAANVHQGEKYTIRRKILKLFGASFHVFDASGEVIAFCKQKAFKLREDIRIYTDEDMQTELFSLKARTIMDFSTTYDVTLPGDGGGEALGSLRRKGMASTFVRDSWLVFDADGNEIASIVERGAWLAFARRMVDLVAIISPQKFDVKRPGDDAHIATLRQHFNPAVYRLGVTVHEEDPSLDDLMILASACLIAAIEGRQG
ncbi:MAG: hypothetical protein AAF235_10970 [Planctomycetota bacterium]